MITIDGYTAAWDAAMRPLPPRVGTTVRVSNTPTPDAREYDGLMQVLRRHGLDLDWIRYMPRAKCDVFKVVRAGRA